MSRFYIRQEIENFNRIIPTVHNYFETTETLIQNYYT